MRARSVTTPFVLLLLQNLGVAMQSRQQLSVAHRDVNLGNGTQRLRRRAQCAPEILDTVRRASCRRAWWPNVRIACDNRSRYHFEKCLRVREADRPC